MKQKKKNSIVIISGILLGLVWGIIYLFFSALHGMTQMFNEESFSFTASILKIRISSRTVGFIFSFADGCLLGSLFGFIFIKIIKRLNK